MTKLGTPFLAALLAVVTFAGIASAETFPSKGRYHVRTTAPVLQTVQQSAVFNAGCMPQAQVITQPAVVGGCGSVITQPAVVGGCGNVVTQPAVIDASNTCGANIVLDAGCRIIEQAAILPGFSMDGNIMCLYTGPRFENTLTMPDGNTYLRN